MTCVYVCVCVRARIYTLLRQEPRPCLSSPLSESQAHGTPSASDVARIVRVSCVLLKPTVSAIMVLLSNSESELFFLQICQPKFHKPRLTILEARIEFRGHCVQTSK